jgi:DNA-binding response OmpR family regulator
MKKRILVIEDNADDLLILERYLNKAGYDEIISAGNVNDGVKKAIDEKPDLVVTDTLLPDSNGFEVCRQIRQSFGASEPKIIIITGSIDAVDAVKAREVGADDYCAKTANCANIIEAVKNLLEGGK